ncbi:MAG: hypothetical protein KDD70_15390, partial [Bdellovibrionales bacterium]|nr:hypothetical protein [Bdellovibrionales bacterium]
LGVATRIVGILEPLWLDEIWTILAVERLASWHEIFTVYRIDNNHPLQSLWVFFVRSFDNPVLYRVFSALCSLGFLAVATLDCRSGKREALYFLFLSATSYVLTLYGTEVRGYGPMICACYFSFLTARRLRDRFSWGYLLLFALSSIVALLAHFSAVTFIAALFLWMFGRLSLVQFGGALFAPAVATALLWSLFHAGNVVAGGDVAARVFASIDLVSVSFGGFELSSGRHLPYSMLVFLIGIVVLSWGMISTWRQSRADFWFFLSAIFLFPAILIVVAQPDTVYPRYFLPSLLGALIMLSKAFSGQENQRLPLLFCSFYFCSNLYLQAQLVAFGRGDYRRVIETVAQEDGNIIFGQAFRHLLPLKYYGRKAGVTLYVTEGEDFGGAPEYYHLPSRPGPAVWMLRIVWEEQDRIVQDDGTVFELLELIPSAPLSGWTTGIYKKRSSRGVREEK